MTTNPPGDAGSRKTDAVELTKSTEIAIASQRSYVGSAVALVFLYWLCYIPGLIANIAWLREAKRTESMIGRPPSGMGCLTAMLVIGLLHAATLLFCLMGPAALLATAVMLPAPKATPGAARVVPPPPPIVMPRIGLALPSPPPRPSPVPTPIPMEIGDKLAIKQQLLVWDLPPDVSRRTSVTISEPFVFVIAAESEFSGEKWIRGKVSDSTGATATTVWCRGDELAKATGLSSRK